MTPAKPARQYSLKPATVAMPASHQAPPGLAMRIRALSLSKVLGSKASVQAVSSGARGFWRTLLRSAPGAPLKRPADPLLPTAADYGCDRSRIAQGLGVNNCNSMPFEKVFPPGLGGALGPLLLPISHLACRRKATARLFFMENKAGL
jgi:hypothetical protein